MYPKFIGVVKYDKDSIWIFIRLKSLIKESFQVVFSKSDSKKSQFAARQKVFQMQYLVIDKDYNCDIYICNIERFKPRHMKSLYGSTILGKDLRK